jgi:hypothetical protein
MTITRTSVLTGVTRTRDLDIHPLQVQAYAAGALLQDAFSNLSPSDREFFKTGITDEEWDHMFGERETELEREEVFA